MKIAIFASGSGTNAENISRYFERVSRHNVTLILTDNPEAGVLKRARELQVPSFVFSKSDLNEGRVLQILREQAIDFVILAGFLKLIPEEIVDAFPRAIVNVHPALLPKFGGKGMYGSRVHQAVKDAEENETGITIHYVNGAYDEGDIILQKAVDISKSDSIADIEKKVHKLEYEYFPKVIENCLDELAQS